MMKSFSWVIGSSLLIVLSGASYAADGCFHGWVSAPKNTYPTGYCAEKKSELETKIMSRIEIDYPTQKIYIHGNISHAPNKSTYFRYDVTTCHDVEDGWTSVSGVADNGEKYELLHREIREIPATGQAKQAFEGEAKLYFELEGKTHQAVLECVRYVF